MTVCLQQGDLFPAIDVNLPERTLHVPADLTGSYAVVLFYRGSWCPYCNAQLAAFQRALPQLQEADVQVVALSVEDAETTAALVAKRRLTFPVGHGAQAQAIAAATGAFVNEAPPYLQSTGFLLDQEGRVVVSVYSSGAIGRLMPDDVLGLLRHLREDPAA